MQLIALALACAVAAQTAYNTIVYPGQNVVVQAGGGVQSLTWTNTSQGNVRVVLYSGSNPLTPRQTLADSIPNTGTYLWNPATWLPLGSDYVISVEDISGNAPIQYSRYFTVQLCSTCSASPIPTTLSAPTGQVTPTAVPTLASTVSQAQFAAAAASTTDGSVAASASASGAGNASSATASASAALGSAGSAAGAGNLTTMSRASGSANASGSATIVSGTRVPPSGSAAASGNATTSTARSTGATLKAGLALVFGGFLATLLL